MMTYCSCCKKEEHLKWWVSDDLWKKAVLPYYQKKILCIECFLHLAIVLITLKDIHIEEVI